MINNKNNDSIPSWVLADIGGTNARFALYSPDPAGGIELRELLQFRCRQFNNFSDALSTYLDQVGVAVEGASVSIAGPADVDQIVMTNLEWVFSIEDLKKQLNLKHMWVINDAAAAALSTTCATQLELIKPGHAEAGAARINLIPGTGFGVGSIVPLDDGWLPIQGEGGHATLAAVTDEEFSVLHHITKDYGRAIVDSVLSGPGMLIIYKALAAVRGQKALDVDPREMTLNAINNHDATSVDALDLYCVLLGRLAGDLALTMNAHGGVYLSGDLLQRVGAERMTDSFNSGFMDKGKMTAKVDRIPVFLLNSEYPCLKGASVWLNSQLARMKNSS
jgi:glucokinase